MTFDLERIVQGKRQFRIRLAAQPIAEKLRMLDKLRERTLSIRNARLQPAPSPESDDEARDEAP